jgi:integrating conjugative element protein (TIGR03749 family)
MKINKVTITLICLLYAIALLPAFAKDSVERIFWDKKPLKITLAINKERMITFPTPVRIGLPVEINSQLRTQINNNTVYWLAYQAFKSQRIEIRAVDGSVIYLVDLSAKEKGVSDEPIEVSIKASQTSPDVADQSNQGDGYLSPKQNSPGYILLTRFAAQQLFAPTRLLQNNQDIYRTPVNREAITYLIQGAMISAKPVAAWKKNSLYVTAIELKNLSSEWIALDPRKIRGKWQAATFQYTQLQPRGSEYDTSALYLISDRPYHELF